MQLRPDDPLLQMLQSSHAPTAVDESQYRSYNIKRAMSRDKTASAACSMLLSSALLYNITILWRLVHMEAAELAGQSVSALVVSATAAVCWVLSHVLMELAFMCYVSRAPALYKRHRSGCIMLTRTGLLLLMSVYIPKTYDHTMAVEVHAGRAASTTLRLVTGFVAIHVLEVLCFRLPFKVAAPYHTARVAFCLAILPSTLRSFAKHPAATAVACEVWQQLGQMYLGTASWVLGVPLPMQYNATATHSVQQYSRQYVTGGTGAGGNVLPTAGAEVLSNGTSFFAAAALPQQQQAMQFLGVNDTTGAFQGGGAPGGLCTVAVLLVFVNISLGLLVPLYVLFVWEVSGFNAFLAAGDLGSVAASSASTTSVGRSSSSFTRSSSSFTHSSSSFSSVASVATGEPGAAPAHHPGTAAAELDGGALPVLEEGSAAAAASDAGLGSSNAAAGAAAGLHGAAAAAAGGQQQQQRGLGGHHGSSGGSGSSSLRGSSLLQAALAARSSAATADSPRSGATAAHGVAPFGSSGSSGRTFEGPHPAALHTAAPAGAAAAAAAGDRSGGQEGGGGVTAGRLDLSEVWPMHFTVPMHAMMLFCLTGFVWVGVNTAWGFWQRRYGEGACFVVL